MLAQFDWDNISGIYTNINFSSEELVQLTDTLAQRIGHFLERKELLERDAPRRAVLAWMLRKKGQWICGIRLPTALL